MTKIIAIIATATIIGVITTAVAKVIGVDPWWAEVIGTATTMVLTADLIRGWPKTQTV